MAQTAPCHIQVCASTIVAWYQRWHSSTKQSLINQFKKASSVDTSNMVDLTKQRHPRAGAYVFKGYPYTYMAKTPPLPPSGLRRFRVAPCPRVGRSGLPSIRRNFYQFPCSLSGSRQLPASPRLSRETSQIQNQLLLLNVNPPPLPRPHS